MQVLYFRLTSAALGAASFAASFILPMNREWLTCLLKRKYSFKGKRSGDGPDESGRRLAGLRPT